MGMHEGTCAGAAAVLLCDGGRRRGRDRHRRTRMDRTCRGRAEGPQMHACENGNYVGIVVVVVVVMWWWSWWWSWWCVDMYVL